MNPNAVKKFPGKEIFACIISYQINECCQTFPCSTNRISLTTETTACCRKIENIARCIACKCTNIC